MKVERNEEVKKESDMDERPYEIEIIQCQTAEAQVEILRKEKESIIQGLVNTKETKIYNFNCNEKIVKSVI